MPTTIIGGDAPALPETFTHPILNTCETWQDPWQFDSSLEFESMEIHASSAEVSHCRISRRYGNVKRQEESTLTQQSDVDLTGWFLQVQFASDDGGDPTTQFVGILESAGRKMEGKDDNPSGIQYWVAYSPLRWLQRLRISTSVFINEDSSTSTVGWIPAMNSRDRHNLIVGNMSSGTYTPDGSAAPVHCYGDTNVWSHSDYLAYIVGNYIQQSDEGAPVWTIGGQADVLNDIQTTIRFGDNVTAYEVLRELIPVRYGMDFMITPTADGFEITVFTLTTQDQSFAGTKLVANPNLVQVIKQDSTDLVETKIVESDEQRYDKIQVIGKRIVVCGTLYGSGVPYQPGGGQSTDDSGATLVAKWNASLEAEYIAAASSQSTAFVGDQCRKRDRYRDIYQHFGAPVTWDIVQAGWGIACLDDGTPALPSDPGFDSTPEFQVQVRETLGWLPLEEGFDYSTDPATDNTLAGSQPEYKPPLAWIYDDTFNNPGRYVLCEHVGIGVHHPQHDWGIFLSASPNHKLALDHWSNAQMQTTLEPAAFQFDYDTLVATIAIESDHRLNLVYNLPDELAAGDGSVLTVSDAEAECWVLLPQTVVDLDTNGVFQTSGSTMRVLRSDTSRLGLVMAGLVARYVSSRYKTQLEFRGFKPWGNLIGNILTVVQQGDDLTNVGGPITCIKWTLSPIPSTIVQSGYA